MASHRAIGARGDDVIELVIAPERVLERMPPPDIRIWYSLPFEQKIPVESGDFVDFLAKWPTESAVTSGFGSLLVRDAEERVIFLAESNAMMLSPALELPLSIQATGSAAYWASHRDSGGTCETVSEHRLARIEWAREGSPPGRGIELAPGATAVVESTGQTWSITLVDCQRTLRTTCARSPEDSLIYILIGKRSMQ